jgi:hypothetical protein
MEIVNIFIGYDKKETVAYHALCQSIIETSSRPVSITPINLSNLKHIYSRKIDNQQSNEFSFSRFLVPYLQSYTGYGIFLDCDMMIKSDIYELIEIASSNPSKAVHVVKHDYIPKEKMKYLNNVQHNYPRKNWSSVIVWNSGHEKNKKLDLSFVNSASGAELHRFTWLDDNEIGELDVTWNWLVGELDLEDGQEDKIKNVHWTVGGPYFNEYATVDFADEWFALKSRLNFCQQRENL